LISGYGDSSPAIDGKYERGRLSNHQPAADEVADLIFSEDWQEVAGADHVSGHGYRPGYICIRNGPPDDL
jgi:hypothetical protein